VEEEDEAKSKFHSLQQEKLELMSEVQNTVDQTAELEKAKLEHMQKLQLERGTVIQKLLAERQMTFEQELQEQEEQFSFHLKYLEELNTSAAKQLAFELKLAGGESNHTEMQFVREDVGS
jgi:hypothetical protein